MTTPEQRERAIDAAIEELGWEWETEPGIPSPRELAGDVVDAILAAIEAPVDLDIGFGDFTLPPGEYTAGEERFTKERGQE